MIPHLEKLNNLVNEAIGTACLTLRRDFLPWVELLDNMPSLNLTNE